MKYILCVSLFAILFQGILAYERHLADEASDSTLHRCGTAPGPDDWKAREHAQQFREFLESRNPQFREEIAASIQVPVCFHIPQRQRFGGETISNDQLQSELNHLNQGYSNSSCCDAQLGWCLGECSVETGISFVMATLDESGKINGTTNSTSDPAACVSRPINRRWMRVNLSLLAIFRRETHMKRALRKGDESVLNIYYTSITTLISVGGGILGYATLPQRYTTRPQLDGVVISRNAIRGGSTANYNEGDTLVHEVGHWMGLFHTFQSGCSPGDGIDDTAPERSPNLGCSPGEKRNTCPGDGQLDPIFNFMDYSFDTCLYKFTSGQTTTMVDAYLAFRSPSLRTARMLRPIFEGLHEMGSLESGASQVFQMDHVPLDSLVSCHLENGADGNVDLFMNSHGRFSDFECLSESDKTSEECSVKVISDRVYVFVHAILSVSEFTLVCGVDCDVLNIN